MTTAPQAYLKTRVLTASPAELRLMLLEGAIRFAHQAKDGLVNKNYERSFEGFTRCQNILLELVSALDASKAPELCNRLAGIYTFLFNRMLDASSKRDTAIVDEVLKLLEYERETWLAAMEAIGERPASGAASNAPQPVSPPQSTSPSRLQSTLSVTG